MDSWYKSEKVINSCNRKGLYVITTVKTNRLICPAGISIQISDFMISLHSTFIKLISAQLPWKVREYTGFIPTKDP
ncbi:hypothetical protein GK047_26155 [Paenibacillus sp. SYP-B3998]|uniref:Uncharacterized protein n=1 Tax=Paenibacillus sp. SYP-B3998 TaxID=2678564 RepID=A0A6G4A525_9BACL|nr:hypothetical protein [Paenibacillus sp. SYP-B3998]NEW09430.1 hypothetical protein [Paenibacillus sp. SYP-B3998]